MKVTIAKAIGFTPDEMVKLSKAASLLESILNSDIFKGEVRAHGYYAKEHWWSKSKWVNAFRMSKGLSTNGVYLTIMRGSEVLSPEGDNEADIQLTIDRRDAGDVLGYTYSSTAMQWIYASFFGRATTADIAANLAHEYCHKLGFDHEFNRTADRQYTVPYGVGYIVKRLAVEVLNGKA